MDQAAIERWKRHYALEARLSAALSRRMLELARVGPGMRVLDVATGIGEPAIPAARRVGPEGRVLGIDRNETWLGMARERARREGLAHVELRPGNAEAFEVDAPFDVATIRWALMYFARPDDALACVRKALVPGGTLVAAVWCDPDRVEYAGLPRRVLARFREVPPLPAGAPDPFRLADEAVMRAELERAGFAIERVEELFVPVIELPDGHGFVQWVRDFQSRVRELVDELPEAQRKAFEAALAAEAERFRRGDTIQIGGVTRLALARRSP